MTPDTASVLGDRIAIVQMGSTGHRLFYVRTLLEAARDSCHVLLITSAEAVSSPEMALHLGPHIASTRFDVATLSSTDGALGRIWRLSLLLHEFRATRLILLDGDRQLLSAVFHASLLRSRTINTALLIMRTPALTAGGLQSRVRAALKMACVRLASVVGGERLELYFLTDSFTSIQRRRGYRALKPVPDPPQRLPLVTRVEARGHFGFKTEDFVIGLLGAQTRSKHADLVLSAAVARTGRVHVLVAGPFDEWTSRQVAHARAAGARVTTARGYLEHAELASCVNACDAIALTYELDAPSGFLVFAYQAHIPVLAAGSPWITKVVKDQQLGVVCDLTSGSIGAAIDVLARMPADRRLEPRVGREPPKSGSFERVLLASGRG